MKKMGLIFIIFIIFFVFTVDAEVGKIFFSIILEYDKSIITSKEVKLIQNIDDVNKKETIGDYNLKLYSFDEKILYETKFDFDLKILNAPPKEWFDEEGNQIYIPNETEGGIIILEKTMHAVFIPYFKTAKNIKIYNLENELILTIDVSEYAVCNLNSVCDDRETKQLCSEDCTYESSINYIVYIVIGIVAIFIIIFFAKIKRYI